MIESELHELLRSTGAQEASQESRIEYLLARIGSQETLAFTATQSEFDVDVLAETLETLAAGVEDDEFPSAIYEHAFLCRRNELPDEPLARLRHLTLLAADGILANRRPEVMLALRESGIPERSELIDEDTPLDLCLEHDIFRSFLLLARRGEGWEDLNASRDAIMQLRQHQQTQQDSYLASQDDKASAGVKLIARFNLAKIVEIASSYTINGQPADAEIQLDRHERNLRDLFKISPDFEFEADAFLMVNACRSIIASSIWKNTRLLGQDFRSFVSALAAREKNPTLELWPSQRKALEQHLLDPARRAIVVEMPTSAGKTLVAEFSIVQAHALNRNSTVAYIVPTRALVNQITQRLRKDFRPLGLVVEAAAPVFELDPTEDQLLRQKIDVLVCTPEKLDLLVKSGHEAVRDLSLVVVDEAHNLGDGDRGVRMELLLGTVKRERPETRFLMLTPFVPNAAELGRWLGDAEDTTISASWRPSERVAAYAHWYKVRRGPHVLNLTTLDSADNLDVPAGHTVELLRTNDEVGRSKSVTSCYAAVELARKGSVLVLAKGRGTAEHRAADIAELREERPLSEFARAVVNYIALEYGENHPLVTQVRRGVTYHHAGVSHDLRFLLESLIEHGDVDVVCGTTTLAQGLNFPISSVILETITKPQGGFGDGYRPLSYSEFWNIAGRAGRALQDALGLVVFPAQQQKDKDEVQCFLRMQAANISSHLMKAAADLSGVVEAFDLSFVRQNKSLAVFLQYLAHAARVAGAAESSRDIEELLRSSLVYHQARETDRRLADQLISIARKFMSELEQVDRGYLALADGTGFSLPSVNYAFAKSIDNPDLRTESFWDTDNLFGSDISSLTSVIEVLAGIPELTLGVEEDASAPFNARTVAGIARDWVNGQSLSDIGERWFRFGDHDTPLKRLKAASHYVHGKLVGQVPWGMGALQKVAAPQRTEEAGFNSYAGAMIFYGVSSPDAVAMRMAGVPRAVAANLGAHWSGSGTSQANFEDLRSWIAQRPIRDWAAAVPRRAQLSGEQCRMIWQAIAGHRD